jgi:hypothetical protein
LAERLEAPPTEFSVADPMQRAGEIASQIAPAETSHTNGSRRELPFTDRVSEDNSPGSFDATGLPATLAVDTSTGLISGMPSAVGTFSVILKATNAGGTGTATLTLTINPPPPTITSPLSATAKAGQPFAYKITGANSPSSYEAIGLPAGLTVNTITGEINGKPSLTGTFLVNLYATNGGGTGRAELSIDVIPPPPVITSPLSATATAGQQFVYQIVASSDSSGGGV